MQNLDNNQLVCDSHMNCMLKDDLLQSLVSDLRKTDKMQIEGDFQAAKSDMFRASTSDEEGIAVNAFIAHGVHDGTFSKDLLDQTKL